jgi:trimeric autotransporter adhesin
MKKFLSLTGIFLGSVIFTANAQVFELVKEINSAGSSSPYSFTVAGNKLFFTAVDNANALRLWVSEGTAATTELIGPPGIAGNNISDLVSYKNKLFFSCSDAVNGRELWVSDGTVAGTSLFKDLYPGTASSFPIAFTVVNNKLFFLANGVTGERRLYVSDGTAAGTVILWDSNVPIFNGLNGFAFLNNDIYFISHNGTGSGYGLWKSNGTAAGTVLVKPDIIPGGSPGFAVLNNKMYFSASDNTYGLELWVTDGTNAGTHIVKNLSSDGGGIFGNGSPQNFKVYNSKIYFAARDDTHGMELFVTDGTDAGTQLVKDILPGTTGSQPYHLNVYNGLLYISCWQLGELWKTDGTNAGTALVKAVSPYVRFGATWNNKMYLISPQVSSIWESDGSAAGTKVMEASNTTFPITTPANDPAFTEYNGNIYFAGYSYNITEGYEPSRLTAPGAVATYTFTGSGNWSNPANWAGGLVPPATLPSGRNIVISGNCILDVTQTVQTGASITVSTGANLLILGSLTLM